MFQGLNRSGCVMPCNNRLVRSSGCVYDNTVHGNLMVISNTACHFKRGLAWATEPMNQLRLWYINLKTWLLTSSTKQLSKPNQADGTSHPKFMFDSNP